MPQIGLVVEAKGHTNTDGRMYRRKGRREGSIMRFLFAYIRFLKKTDLRNTALQADIFLVLLHPSDRLHQLQLPLLIFHLYWQQSQPLPLIYNNIDYRDLLGLPVQNSRSAHELIHPDYSVRGGAVGEIGGRGEGGGDPVNTRSLLFLSQQIRNFPARLQLNEGMKKVYFIFGLKNANFLRDEKKQN